ncbi:MAG: S1C family serine protease [Microvirga sp.]
MFVPTDGLHPILGDLLAAGRVSGPGRPWLGVAANEVRGALVVARVTPGGPAEQAGVRAGDTIVAVNGETVGTLAAFYRKVWAQGGAGAVVTLELSRNDETRRIEVRSMNRLDHLRLKSSL